MSEIVNIRKSPKDQSGEDKLFDNSMTLYCKGCKDWFSFEVVKFKKEIDVKCPMCETTQKTYMGCFYE